MMTEVTFTTKMGIAEFELTYTKFNTKPTTSMTMTACLNTHTTNCLQFVNVTNDLFTAIKFTVHASQNNNI
jgi:hypothetical protein